MERIDFWHKRGTEKISSIEFGDGVFVGVGRGIFTSSDGIKWISRQNPLQGILNSEFSDVAASGKTFVAVQPEGGDLQPQAYPLLSEDGGASWRSPGIPAISFIFPMAIAADDCLFIMVGNPVGNESAIRISMNSGLTWETVFFPPNSPFHWFSDICVGHDIIGSRLFVAVGCGIIPGTNIHCFYSAASLDGVSWTESLSGSIGEFLSVAYGNGVFVAVGSNRSFYTSKDGVTWTGTSYQTLAEVFKITFGKKIFVAVGAGGYVYDSYNGDKWSVRYIGASEALKDIHYGSNTFLAIGANGTIYQSERYDRPLLNVQLSGYGSVEVKYDGVDVRTMQDWGGTFDHGKTVTLIAHNEASAKWVVDPFGNLIRIPVPIICLFDYWSGPVSNSGSSTTTVTMDSDKTVVAHFKILIPKRPQPPNPTGF